MLTSFCAFLSSTVVYPKKTSALQLPLIMHILSRKFFNVPVQYSSVSVRNNRVTTLGRIQDLTKGSSDKRPLKAVAPRGVREHASPENF